MTAPARHTQAGIARAIRALAAAGVPVERVGICHYPDGRVVVQAVPDALPAPAAGPQTGARGWDDV